MLNTDIKNANFQVPIFQNHFWYLKRQKVAFLFLILVFFKMPKMAIKFYEMDPLSPTYFSIELIIFSINLFQPKFCTERFPLDLNHNFTQMLHFSRDTLLTVCPFESDSFTT